MMRRLLLGHGENASASNQSLSLLIARVGFDFEADFSPVVRLFREAVARDVHPLSLLVLVLVLRLDVVV